VAVASYVTCVLTAAGAVGCTNTGPGTDRSVLTIMVPSGAVAIGAGTDARCVVMTDGTVRCWGDNTVGQLGDGTTTARTTPVTVPGITTAVDIVSGPRHTCVRLMDGTVRCWGENNFGQLGDGTTTNRSSPVTVSGLSDVDMFARDSYAYHVCARRTDGSVWCWGYNNFYVLGDGTNVMRTRPVRMQF
jgi:alpha-tubulin suppressor-like RCC1 family protein